MVGARVCPMHGGMAKQVRAAAARRVQRQRAQAAISRLVGEPVTVEPINALLGVVYEAAGNVELMRQLVRGLSLTAGPGLVDVVDDSAESPDDAEWERHTELRDGIAMPDHLGDLRVHPFFTMYNDALERLARVSREAIKAGLEERQVQLSEQQGVLIASVLNNVLTACGVDIAAPEVRRVMADQLRLAAGAVIDAEVVADE
jgi:hypothetical protein